MIFGLHKDLWTFIRKLKQDQDRQQSEENQYVLGGQVPAKMKRKDIDKEQELITLRRFFINSPQLRVNAYAYLCGVAKKMRQYNLARVVIANDEEEEEKEEAFDDNYNVNDD